MKPALFVGLLAGLGVFADNVSAETYQIDPRHAQVFFTYSHLGYSNISARFDNIEGQIVYDPADVAASSVTVTVPIDTVSSGVEEMDAHFRRDDLLDATRFPTATFQSTSVAAAGEGRLTVTGDLTIHGVTKQAVFDVTVNGTGEHPMRKGVAVAGFDAVGRINRSDFGVDAYLQAVPDEITIRVSAEALGPEPESSEG